MIKNLKTLALGCLTLIAASTMAQNINLRFSGTLTNGDYIRLDSIKVENLDSAWTETLVYPDTILVLNNSTQRLQNAENRKLGIENFPNPFDGNSKTRITLPKSGIVTLQMHNLSGQKIAEHTLYLNAGAHLFDISLNNSQVGLLTVTTDNCRSTIKLLNKGNGKKNAIIYTGHDNNKTQEKRVSINGFRYGNTLRFTGYSTQYGLVYESGQITENQFSLNENILLQITAVNLPTVTTISVSNITDSTAVSGGNVTDSGGLAVTACGVCWSTSHNPTIANRHTANGNAIGSFTSNITNLITGTTYYIRAYASNPAGTAYGNEIAFRTTFTPFVSGSFSIDSGRYVQFSPGNLQFSRSGNHAVASGGTSSGTWRFAEHQWDTIGNENANGSYGINADWIDLFSFACSGYGDGPRTYHMIIRPNDTTISKWWYDWGWYNAIYNTSSRTTNPPRTWYTLTANEWNYLLNRRKTSSGIRYAKACVNGINGLIILPDNWDIHTLPINNSNSLSSSFNNNVISLSQWHAWEDRGAVFLPAAGICYRGTIYGCGSAGRYWLGTMRYQEGYSYFFGTTSIPVISGSGTSSFGHSVRLVKDITVALPPTVTTTTAVHSIFGTSAAIGCNVSSDGGGSITARGVCWDTTHNPTIFSNHTIDSSGLGSFTSKLTGLAPNTTYYVRAYATNSTVTAYSNEVTFKTIPDGCIGLFSVSNRLKVSFSCGNLQYTNSGTHSVAGGSTARGTWRFAPNQWDTIGSANHNISSSYSGWIDLFGWATSGFNNNPYTTSTVDTNYLTGLTEISGTNYDWGGYNAIFNTKYNTTDTAGTWRTLTNGEWYHLLFGRYPRFGIRFAKAVVNGVPGLILVPDYWDTSTYTFNQWNSYRSTFTSNIITQSCWTRLENAGCVFLPAAGYRVGYPNVVNYNGIEGVGTYGSYWSSTTSSQNIKSRRTWFYIDDVSATTEINNSWGLSVRLVKNVQ